MIRGWKATAFLFLSLAIAPAVIAQAVCPDIVQNALDTADQFCAGTGRNEACYGHFAVEATPQGHVPALDFIQEGDIEDLSKIQTITMQAMNLDALTWGITLMQLQANLPGALPGQNVTFLMFGEVEIASAVPIDVSSDYTPMQAFSLRSGLGDSQCAEAPDSGLMVQTPEGVGEVTFEVNGVHIAMGSTVIFQAQREGDMTVSSVEGMAVLQTNNGETQTLIAGTRLRVPMDGDLRPFRGLLMNRPEPYEISRLQGLPLRLLQRPIRARLPLTDNQMNILNERIANGEMLCGEAPLPACESIPTRLLVRSTFIQRDTLEQNLDCRFRRLPRERATNRLALNGPFCDQEAPETLPCVFVPVSGEALQETETRPFCPQFPEALEDDGLSCILRRPGDTALPRAGRFRPFCLDPASDATPEGETEPEPQPTVQQEQDPQQAPTPLRQAPTPRLEPTPQPGSAPQQDPTPRQEPTRRTAVMPQDPLPLQPNPIIREQPPLRIIPILPSPTPIIIR